MKKRFHKPGILPQIIIAVLLLLICCIVSITYGAKAVGYSDIRDALFDGAADSFNVNVVRARIPRTIFGVIAGAALATAGCMIMGITELADRCVDELSGGQRQRVWIALALAQNTDILLLDEPITYLDVAYQVEILNIIKRLNETKGTTIAMVLHDINLSARYANHIFAMKNGELIAQGAPKDIITPEMMDEVFGLKCTIIEDPVAGTPLVVPL